MDSKHPIDQWEDAAEASQSDFEKQALLDTSLVFSVFATPNGKMLLDRWKELLIHTPTAFKGADQITIGINEGNKAFMRSIIQAIKIHEDAQ